MEKNKNSEGKLTAASDELFEHSSEDRSYEIFNTVTHVSVYLERYAKRANRMDRRINEEECT